MSRPDFIQTIAREMEENRENHPDVYALSGIPMPDKEAVIRLIRDLRTVVFWGYFGNDRGVGLPEEILERIYETLKTQLCLAFRKSDWDCRCRFADETARSFLSGIPDLQRAMMLDLEAAFTGDPAAVSKSEIIFSYPGFLAVFVYRAAHILYQMGVPLLPRMMTEYAHSRTGIDIHAGATIGKSFFIDHGTGVVIGETTVIGDSVKLYQGVTLGALSTRAGRELFGKKRHPTISDNVTIYSGATILGGDTVIGQGSVIGGNVFLAESVPPFTKVSIKAPDLVYKEGKKDNGKV